MMGEGERERRPFGGRGGRGDREGGRGDREGGYRRRDAGEGKEGGAPAGFEPSLYGFPPFPALGRTHAVCSRAHICCVALLTFFPSVAVVVSAVAVAAPLPLKRARMTIS